MANDVLLKNTRTIFQLPKNSQRFTSSDKQNIFQTKESELFQYSFNLNLAAIRFLNTDFTSLTTNRFEQFWMQLDMDTDVEELILDNCRIKHDKLMFVIDKLKHLRRVTINLPTKLYDCIELIEKLMFRVKSLTLSGKIWNQKRIVFQPENGVQPTLEKLSFTRECHFLELEIVSLFEILEFSLKHLEITLRCAYSTLYNQLVWFNDLNLNLDILCIKLLNIQHNDKRNLNALVERQENLQHFEMTYDYQLFESFFKNLSIQMVNLRVLKLTSIAEEIVNYKLLDLSNMHHLEVR